MSKKGEHIQQCCVIDWFRIIYPVFAGCLFSIPNGAYLAGDKKRRIIQMVNLKKEGFKNGVSDLLLALPSLDKCGMWIEMKDAGEKYSSVSKDQREHIALMNNVGYYAIWCAGAENAIKEINDYMESVIKINDMKMKIVTDIKSSKL
jgi:hypothetical protein